jgi:hypothetical protein
MAVTRIDSASEIIVSVDGSAQICDAEDLAGELRKVLDAAAPSVTLSLGGLTAVDVSFFQLILAMNASLAAKGRSLGLQPLPYSHIVMETSGLLGIDLERFFPAAGTKR